MRIPVLHSIQHFLISVSIPSFFSLLVIKDGKYFGIILRLSICIFLIQQS